MRPTAGNDGQLLAEFLSTGRQDPFEEIVRRHQGLVYGTCMRVLGRSHEAEDAAQAVFVALAGKAKSLVDRVSVAGWLHCVAFHVSQHARRSGAVRRKREQEAGRMWEGRREREAAWEQMKPLLDRELAALPEKYRLPLILHHLEGRTQEESARHLGWKPGTLLTRLMRARELLRTRLARRGAAVSGGLLLALLGEYVASAAPPPGLAVSMAKAATSLAAGKGLTTGLVSTQVKALVSGGLRGMMMLKLKMAAAILAAVSVAGAGGGVLAYTALSGNPPKEGRAVLAAPTPGTAPQESKNRLTSATLDELHRLIRPQPGEYRWDEIPWLTSVWHARKKSAEEDKPILIYMTGGAGFNDPLGNC